LGFGGKFFGAVLLPHPAFTNPLPNTKTNANLISTPSPSIACRSLVSRASWFCPVHNQFSVTGVT
jgi:hypothetical protein